MTNRVSFDIGTTYEGKFLPFTEIDFTREGKVIYTLKPDPDEDTVDGEFSFLESRLYGETLVVVIKDNVGGGIFLVDLTKGAQKVYSQLAESTVANLIDGGVILLDLWDFSLVCVYDVSTGIDHTLYNSFTGDRTLKSLVGPKIDWMDDSGEFDWVRWEYSAGENGLVEKGHLIWTDKDYRYDHDLAANTLSVTDKTGKTFTMEQIFGQSEQWIDDILSRNNVEKSTDLVNRINAIVLVHNAGMLISDDNEVVRHRDFFGWATATDDYLSTISPVPKEFIESPSRFNIVRELVKSNQPPKIGLKVIH